MKRIAVVISGNGSNLQALIDACAAGVVDAEIAVVASARKAAWGLERARLAGIPTLHVSALPFKGRPDAREAYDAELGERLAAFAPDLVVLAGFLRIVTAVFLRRFPGRVINLHPALPGELPGLHAIERAWQEAVASERTHTGIMVHEVVVEVDAGPVLGTTVIPIDASRTLEALEQAVHAAEHALLVDVVGRICGQRTHDPSTWRRASAYRHYRSMGSPHMAVTVQVDATDVYTAAKADGRSFFSAMLHHLATAANGVPELRQRIRETPDGDVVVEHTTVDPAFTVAVEGGLFNFASVRLTPDVHTFAADVARVSEAKRDTTELEPFEGVRDDVLF
ncbi:MAG: phosphoribosylglycinamide formyltransferase, partial [Myxococcales bacterium]|nr:phosphoribosylglycinamide formyltransferase [Myxococcales bacterium]